MLKRKRPEDLSPEIPDLLSNKTVNKLFKHFCKVIM